MEFNYFDLIVTIIILFLGLKGIINGLFKEVFGLIGIVGGIFIASRLGDSVGQFLSDLIFNFSNSSAIGFTGFITTLALFWLLMIIIGYIFKKLSILSGLGPIDKILGFIFGASKFFFIAAVIAHAMYNIKTIKNSIDPLLNNSILFPILVETGGFIMKLDPIEISKDINSSIEKGTDTLGKKIDKSAHDIVNDVKSELKKSMPEAAKEIIIHKSEKN